MSIWNGLIYEYDTIIHNISFYNNNITSKRILYFYKFRGSMEINNIYPFNNQLSFALISCYPTIYTNNRITSGPTQIALGDSLNINNISLHESGNLMQ